jgi:hypothetical protein
MMMKPEANSCIQLLIKRKYGDSPTHVHIKSRVLCASNRISSRIWLELEDFTLFTTAIRKQLARLAKIVHCTTPLVNLTPDLSHHNWICTMWNHGQAVSLEYCTAGMNFPWHSHRPTDWKVSVLQPDHAILEKSIFAIRELASRKLPREEKPKKNPQNKTKKKSPYSEIRTDENGTG